MAKIDIIAKKIEEAEKHALKTRPQARGPRVIAIRAEGKEPLSYTPTGMAIWAYDSMGAQVCGKKNASFNKASNSAKGEFCVRRDVRFPSGRCLKHGGGIKSGVLSKQFDPTSLSNTSRYNFLPEVMKRGIEESLNDPSLTSMRKDIAAWDEYIIQITKKLGGIDPEIFKSVIKSSEYLQILLASEYSDDELLKALTEHLEFVHLLRSAEINWQKLQSAQLHRAKLAEVENKRVTSEQTQLPVEKVAALLQRISRGISAAVRKASRSIVENWEAFEEEKKTSRVLEALIIQVVEREIMEDIRPVIKDFFPKPIEVKEELERIKRERMQQVDQADIEEMDNFEEMEDSEYRKTIETPYAPETGDTAPDEAEG